MCTTHTHLHCNYDGAVNSCSNNYWLLANTSLRVTWHTVYINMNLLIGPTFTCMYNTGLLIATQRHLMPCTLANTDY